MIKKQPYGDSLKAQHEAARDDRVYRFLLADGQLRGAVLNGTRMVNEMRANHALGILETLTLGQAYMAGALLAANLKGNDRIALQIDCSGPIRGLVVESNAFGEVRGHLKNVPIPVSGPLESFNLSPFFGAGFLKVTRYLEDAKNPFTGQVMLQYGSIAKDLAHYFLTSEQTPAAFHLSVKFDTTGTVTGAGALSLQVMPGADDEMVGRIEDLVSGMPSIGTEIESGRSPDALVQTALADYRPRFLDDSRIEFMCHCNKEKVRNMLLMLPEDDLRDMRDNGPYPFSVTCHHCSSAYEFTREALQAIYGLRYPDN